MLPAVNEQEARFASMTNQFLLEESPKFSAEQITWLAGPEAILVKDFLTGVYDSLITIERVASHYRMLASDALDYVHPSN